MALRELIARFGIDVDTRQLQKASRQVESFGAKLRGIAAPIAGAFGAKLAYDGLIGANAQLEQMRLNMATVLGIGRNTSLAEQFDNADAVIARLRNEMAQIPGTTQEAVQAANDLAIALAPLGKTDDELVDLSKSVVVASKAFGEQLDVALRDFRQGIQRGVESDDPFGRALLSVVGMADEAGRAKFKALTPQERAKIFEEALGQKAIQDAAGEYSKTFGGMLDFITNDIRMKVQAIGTPIFAFTKRVLEGFNRVAEGTKTVQAALITLGGVALVVFGPFLLKMALVAAALGLVLVIVEDLYQSLSGGDGAIIPALEDLFGLGEGELVETLKSALDTVKEMAPSVQDLLQALRAVLETAAMAAKGLAALFSAEGRVTALRGVADWLGELTGIGTQDDGRLAALVAQNQQQRANLRATRGGRDVGEPRRVELTNNITVNAANADAKEVANEIERRQVSSYRKALDGEPVR